MAGEHVGIAFAAALDAIEEIAGVASGVIGVGGLHGLGLDRGLQRLGEALTAFAVGGIAVAFGEIVALVGVGDFLGNDFPVLVTYVKRSLGAAKLHLGVFSVTGRGVGVVLLEHD